MDRGQNIFGTGKTSTDFKMGGINPSRIEALKIAAIGYRDTAQNGAGAILGGRQAQEL